MRKPIVGALGLGCLIAVAVTRAQDEPRRGTRPSLLGFGRQQAPAQNPKPAAGMTAGNVPTPAPASTGLPAKIDSQVFPASASLPSPTPPDQLRAASITLPNDPIEPWLLTKEAGPFMVMARTFRGPEAERYALALAMELRNDYGLPTYILRTQDFPMRSNIRNVPPLARPWQNKAELAGPEKVRTYDEAAVLVGNEKTLAGSEALLHRVKKIKPKCLNNIPSFFGWREGLSTALRTTNPFVPTQNLYPGNTQEDKLLSRMNSGPRSIYNCPGRFSLQVAEFGGRTVFNPSESETKLFSDSFLRKSPLATAADDAERVADAISKDPEVRRTGQQAYVYHDRKSSKVMVGSFNNPTDPEAAKLRDLLLSRAGQLADKRKADAWIAPAPALTDLENPTLPIKPVH